MQRALAQLRAALAASMSILLAGEFDAAERAQWLDLLRAALPDETIVSEPGDAAAIDIAIVANPPPVRCRACRICG